jgi:hypothetical protein
MRCKPSFFRKDLESSNNQIQQNQNNPIFRYEDTAISKPLHRLPVDISDCACEGFERKASRY